MTIQEAWKRLEDAQMHLERFLEHHGGVFDEESGCHLFPVVSQVKEFACLVEVARCVGDAQGYLETLLEESTGSL